MGTNFLSIKIHDSVEAAPNWHHLGTHKAATLDEAHVVKNGTVGGNPTVDFVFTDSGGQKHVALITGRLLEDLAVVLSACKTERS